jgi:hypothetical protein
MTTDTIYLTASEAVGFVTVTCAVTLSGSYTYDIVLHEDEGHSGNARGLDALTAYEYLTMLFGAVEYAHLRNTVDEVLMRLAIACGYQAA